MGMQAEVLKNGMAVCQREEGGLWPGIASGINQPWCSYRCYRSGYRSGHTDLDTQTGAQPLPASVLHQQMSGSRGEKPDEILLG